MHIKADLLNSIGNVRPCESQVLQGACKAAVGGGVCHGRTIICRDFGTSVNRSGARFAVTHAVPTKDVQNVLPLRKKESVLGALNCHAEKVVQRAKILHGKFILQSHNHTVEELLGGGSEYNVVHIEK
jgi:GMP synthase-like glutamine amidotransferase